MTFFQISHLYDKYNKINNKSFPIFSSQTSSEDSVRRDSKDAGFGDILLFSSCISTKYLDKD